MIHRRHALPLSAFLLGASLLAPDASAQRIDDKPRVVVMSAFQPELTALLGRTQVERKASVNGVELTLGRLAGQDVVLVLSGISMVRPSPRRRSRTTE